MSTVFWIRINSDGTSKHLNSALIHIVDFFAFSFLSDSPPEDNFPYNYQCLAIGKCGVEMRSKYKTVDLLSSTMVSFTTGTNTTPSTAYAGKPQ